MARFTDVNEDIMSYQRATSTRVQERVQLPCWRLELDYTPWITTPLL